MGRPDSGRQPVDIYVDSDRYFSDAFAPTEVEVRPPSVPPEKWVVEHFGDAPPETIVKIPLCWGHWVIAVLFVLGVLVWVLR